MVDPIERPDAAPPPDAASWALPSAGAFLALLCLWFALRAARRKRIVDDTPTSKTTGVFLGVVELEGTAEAEPPVVSFLAEARSVHYAWSVEERWSRTRTETYRDAQGRPRTRTRHESGWKTVASGGETIPFFLQDGEGAILVRPEGARLEPASVFGRSCGRGDPLYYDKGPPGAVMDSDHVRRFHETAILLHAPLYVIGAAREREEVVAPEIAADPQAPLFLISTRTEEEVSRGFAWRFWGIGILGWILAAAGVFARDWRAGTQPDAHPADYAIAAGGYALLWLLSWTVMAYNSLVNLRQRVRQGWANLDVQLKRRSDLLPNLVRIIEGLSGHEREVQADLARLRRQMAATAPWEAGPNFEGCLAAGRAVAERYPGLQADAAYRGLMENLTDTENRIALARAYYNDIATFYNTRLEAVPDRFLAALGGLKGQELLAAADFERAAVEVRPAG